MLLGKIKRAAVKAENARVVTLNAENGVERTAAPPIGSIRYLRNGPVLDGNVDLIAFDGTSWIPGIDFEVIPEGGYRNLAIPKGTDVYVDYWYEAASQLGGDSISRPIDSVQPAPTPGAPSSTAAPATGGMRFATMVKLGLI